jgi:hypothetical protein
MLEEYAVRSIERIRCERLHYVERSALAEVDMRRGLGASTIRDAENSSLARH